MQMNELLLKIKDLGVLQGIGCMAWNPGDQLIRNAFRFCSGRYRKYCKE
jgi:hypothetical protein